MIDVKNIIVIHNKHHVRKLFRFTGRYLFHVLSKVSGGFWTIVGAVLAVLLGVQAVQATEINIESSISVPIEFMANLEIDGMDRIVELLEELTR